MKRVNIRELHENTGAVIDLAAEGHVVVVTRRGVPVAEIGPRGAAGARRTLPDRSVILKRFPDVRGDSGRFLEEERT